MPPETPQNESTDLAAIPLPPEVRRCLDGIQRHLLSKKFRYTFGDEAAWPFPAVEMTDGSTTLLIAPWDARLTTSLRTQWDIARRQGSAACGLLLVGSAPVDDEGLRNFLDSIGGSWAYLDAARGRFDHRRQRTLSINPPKELKPRKLKRYLDPAFAERAPRTDCRSTLARHLHDIRQTEAFIDKAREAGGSETPWLTRILIGLCVGLFVLMMITGGRSLKDWESPSVYLLQQWGANFGPLVKDGQWWRIVTCAFIHVGIAHLGFNMYAMWIFGEQLERLQGRWRTLFFFFFAAIAASLASLWWNPQTTSAGASGALFGWVGVTVAIVVRHRRDFPKKLWSDMGRGLAMLLILNLVFLTNPHIDNAAHIGGLISGFLVGLVLTRSPVRRASPSWVQWAGTVGLACLIGAFGIYAVNRVPEDLPRDPRLAQLPSQTRQLSYLERLHRAYVSGQPFAAGAERLFEAAWQSPPEKYQQAAAGLRNAVAELEKRTELDMYRELLREEYHPSVSAAERAIALRMAYVETLLSALTGKAERSDVEQARTAWLEAEGEFMKQLRSDMRTAHGRLKRNER